MPDEIKAKLQKGEIVSKMISDDVMTLKWMDKCNARTAAASGLTVKSIIKASTQGIN